MRIRSALAICVAAALASSGAADDVLVMPLKNGDRVVGTTRGDSVDRFEFECPAGARVRARLAWSSNRRGPALGIGGPIADGDHVFGLADSTHAVDAARCRTSDVYTATVYPDPWAKAPVRYELRIDWRSRERFGPRRVRLDGAGAGAFTFAADEGARVECAVASLRAGADLSLTGVDGPRGFFATFSGGRVRSFVAPSTGDYTVRFAAADGANQDVRAGVRVSSRTRRRNLRADAKTGTLHYGGVAIVGPEGGRLVVADGLLAGAVLDVPALALPDRRQVMLGEARPIVPDATGTLRPAGPAIAVRGLAGRDAAGPTVSLTLPFDPGRVAGAPRILTKSPAYPGGEVVDFQVDVGAVRFAVAATVDYADGWKDGRNDFQVFGDVPAPAPIALDVGASLDRLGTSIAARGGVVAVGAPGDDALGEDAGEVRVFDLANAGDPGVTLRPSSLLPGDGFGRSVALSRDGATLAVGTESAEAVFVYSRVAGVWTLDARIDSPEPVHPIGFGHAVAVDGGTLLVGAERFHGPGSAFEHVETGGVFEFERDAAGWSARPPLEWSVATGAFGTSVAIDGDRAVVGAPLAGFEPNVVDHVTVLGGDVHVLVRIDGEWRRIALLYVSDPALRVDGFGRSVALDGATVLVGADHVCGDEQWSVGCVGMSGAFLFEAAEGGYYYPPPTLLRSEIYGDSFGAAVSLAGPFAVVGAPGTHVSGAAGAGNATVFVREPGGWCVPRRTLTLDAPPGGERLGAAVAVDGTTLVVGAPGAARDSGAALTVDLAPLK